MTSDQAAQLGKLVLSSMKTPAPTEYSTELRDPTCKVALACGINPTTEGWSPWDPFEVDVETGDHLFVVIHWLPPLSVIADLDWDFTFVVTFTADEGGPPPPPP